jgi:outer membrane protein OmpA-like peptidoglycan-associated protein
MNAIIKLSRNRQISNMSLNKYFKNIIWSIIVLTCLVLPSEAQTYKYEKPTWLFGIAGGANLNYYRGSTQQLNSAFTPPVAFHNGFGTGLYLAPVVEYHSLSGLGLMLQAGYDSRDGSFDQVISPCNCPADLTVNLTYITLEPSLRFAPGNSNFYVFGGPRLAFNTEKSFVYKLGLNPSIPDQEATPDVKGDLSSINNKLLSFQVGAGYDIPLNSRNNHLQVLLSPFVSFQPYFGQSPRGVETWNLTTLRVGAALKFGQGQLIPLDAEILTSDGITFSIYSPKNIAAQRVVKETFPLRNYVFFDPESSEIPDRYVLINKNQSKDFMESQPEIFKPKILAGRSEREMTVYYNILNIVGERMYKNPSSKITLVGSSEKGPAEGTIMANSIKKYLHGIFSIDTSRIMVEGRNKPKIPSEQPGGTLDLDLLRAGDRRVSIESNSPALLMEFNNTENFALRPVELKTIQNAPIDSYVTFNVEGAKKELKSWALEITDNQGYLQTFGPYTADQVSLPGKSILRNQKEGNYKIRMKGIKKDGTLIEKSASSHIVLWTPSKDDEGMRYSVLYEFNDAKVIPMYEKYLSEIIAPKIKDGNKVIIHGYTDIIGSDESNYALSVARANDVLKILQNSIAKTGVKNVRFEVYGFGENAFMSPFDNKYPEERFYNRTVIIDIIPTK